MAFTQQVEKSLGQVESVDSREKLSQTIIIMIIKRITMGFKPKF